MEKESGVKLGPENQLPEELGKELWRVAGAALVELSEAEFADGLETIGGRENFGLDPGSGPMSVNERHSGEGCTSRSLPSHGDALWDARLHGGAFWNYIGNS